MRRTVWSVATLLILSGCSRSGPAIIPIETARVHGTATYQGKALENYRVFFYQSGHAAQEPATGRVGPDGHFSLSVRAPDDGAMIGTNEVWFAYDPEIPEQVPGLETAYDLPPPSVELPREYLDRKTSGLTVEVPAQGLEGYALNLE
jgi:hypothetical protein